MNLVLQMDGSNSFFTTTCYAKPQEKNATNKNAGHYRDDTWSNCLLELKDYGAQNYSFSNL